MEDEHKANYADDFPSSANEPVFEALPDYRLTTDEMPLFETGENKLSTAQPDERLFDETTLDEKTLKMLLFGQLVVSLQVLPLALKTFLLKLTLVTEG